MPVAALLMVSQPHYVSKSRMTLECFSDYANVDCGETIEETFFFYCTNIAQEKGLLKSVLKDGGSTL